jgi:hypothetical protein
MPTSTICYGAIIPQSGFRWIRKEDSGQWKLCDPPDDWPEVDYEAAAFYNDQTPDPKLTNRFHLAAHVTECLKTHQDLKSEFGQMIGEPDLYLKFASTRPTPSAILGLANTYGLLRYPITGPGPADQEMVTGLSRANAPDIAAAFPYDPFDENRFSLFVEPAEKWLGMYEAINYDLRTWAKFQANEDVEGMSSYLEDGYNYAMGGSLTYQAKIDRVTGQTYSKIIATSLARMLEVQWGMSVAANTVHRQCEECPTWFNVAPGSGRPEKQFCSDACRMRAYRKRKAQGSRRRTGKSQRSP